MHEQFPLALGCVAHTIDPLKILDEKATRVLDRSAAEWLQPELKLIQLALKDHKIKDHQSIKNQFGDALASIESKFKLLKATRRSKIV